VCWSSSFQSTLPRDPMRTLLHCDIHSEAHEAITINTNSNLYANAMASGCRTGAVKVELNNRFCSDFAMMWQPNKAVISHLSPGEQTNRSAHVIISMTLSNWWCTPRVYGSQMMQVYRWVSGWNVLSCVKCTSCSFALIDFWLPKILQQA